MKKIKLEIFGMSYSQSQSGFYTLILGELDGQIKLPITIGGYEAQAIALKLENITPKRPMTHDLIKTILDTLKVSVVEIIISRFHEGIFHSELVLKTKDNETLTIDSRTSDAVAIAVRTNVPIFTYPEILDKAGIILDKTKSRDTESHEEKEVYDEGGNIKLSSLGIEELESLMNDAIEAEDFEQASELRDEIKRKKLES